MSAPIDFRSLAVLTSFCLVTTTVAPASADRLAPGSAGGADRGASASEPGLHGPGPRFHYVTHFRAHQNEDSLIGSVEVEIQARNGTPQWSRVRVQGYDVGGVAAEQDFQIGPGQRSIFAIGVVGDVEWLVIASEEPLLLFGDVDVTGWDIWGESASWPNVAWLPDCASGIGWSGKRTLAFRELTCAAAPALCAGVEAASAWPSGE